MKAIRTTARARGPALAAFGLAVLSSASTCAANPHLTFIQLTATSACPSGTGGGNAQVSLDAKLLKVVFSSNCELVPGSNMDGNLEIYFMNVDGTGLKQLTSTLGGLGSFESSVNLAGTKVVFASDRDLIPGQNADGNVEIFSMYIDGSGLVQLTNTVGTDTYVGGSGSPHFDPAGKKIVFTSDRDLVGQNPDFNPELFMMNANGTGVVQLTHTLLGANDDGWLNFGATKVVFGSNHDLVPSGNPDLNWEIFMMNIDGTDLVQLTSTTGGFGSFVPRWSADGQTIAFVSDRDLVGSNPDGNYEVFRMNVNGTGVLQLTNTNGGFGSLPTYISPNGKAIGFHSDRDIVPGNNADLNFEIYLLNLQP
jgi:Tol biopolymer transport system component